MTTQRYVAAGTLLAACVVVAVAAEQPRQGNRFEGVKLTSVHVAGNVHMVMRPGGGGNVGVFVGPEGVLLVDSLFAPLADRLVAAVEEISDSEIRFLINTHVHPDHIGGNEALASRGVLIFAHDNVRVRSLDRLRFPRGGGRFSPQPPAGARPVVTYNDQVSFHLNGEEGTRLPRAAGAHRWRHLRLLSRLGCAPSGRRVPHDQLSDYRCLQRRDAGTAPSTRCSWRLTWPDRRPR